MESFDVSTDNIELIFLNGGRAFLRSKNVQGNLEIAAIGKILESAVGKSYNEILEMDF